MWQSLTESACAKLLSQVQIVWRDPYNANQGTAAFLPVVRTGVGYREAEFPRVWLARLLGLVLTEAAYRHTVIREIFVFVEEYEN